MKRNVSSIVAACCLLGGLSVVSAANAAGEPAAPQSVYHVSPVFSQIVAFKVPLDFKVVSDRADGPGYMREYVPKMESGETWTQIITLTGAKGLGGNAKVQPKDMAGTIAASYKQACPDSFRATLLDEGKTKEGYEVLIALMGCGSVPGPSGQVSEVLLLNVVKARQDMYTFQWAHRMAPMPVESLFDVALWNQRQRSMSPIRICDPKPDEKPPYDSCVGH